MNNIIEVNLEAEDVNDEGWKKIIKVLSDNLPGFSVNYGNGDFMTLIFHSHMYEVWSGAYSSDRASYDDNCILSTDSLDEAIEAAKEDIYRSTLELHPELYITEIRTNIDDASGSYDTIPIFEPDFESKYGEGTDCTVICGNKEISGVMYGNDECIEYDSTIEENRFYQILLVGNRVYYCYYDISNDIEIDCIDCDHPEEIIDRTAKYC